MDEVLRWLKSNPGSQFALRYDESQGAVRFALVGNRRISDRSVVIDSTRSGRELDGMEWRTVAVETVSQVIKTIEERGGK